MGATLESFCAERFQYANELTLRKGTGRILCCPYRRFTSIFRTRSPPRRAISLNIPFLLISTSTESSSSFAAFVILDTGEVYKSNLFKLQVDELLQRVRPRHGKKEAHAEDALRTLKGIIERIPDREPQGVSAFGFA